MVAGETPAFPSFTGRRYDVESRLYDYRARIYNPALGRFMQTDPIGYADGMNLYAYCANDPLNWIDPWGLCKGGGDGGVEGWVWPFVLNPYHFLWDMLNFEFAMLANENLTWNDFFDYQSDMGFIGALQSNLDLIGCLNGTPIGTGADALNAVIYGAQGQMAMAGISLLGVIGADYGKAGRTYQHHIFPQSKKLRPFFDNAGIKIHKYTVEITETTHLKGVHGRGFGDIPGRWNQIWENFFRSNPNATSKQIYQQGGMMMKELQMKLWKITEPDYENDYQNIYINGALSHPYRLPGVICLACGETWGGSRFLPFVCPDTLRTEKCIQNSWPIPLEEFNRLSARVKQGLVQEGLSVEELLPGDTFIQPCYLDIFKNPQDDFLWPSIGSLVVSSRIKEFLIKHAEGYITAFKIRHIRTDAFGRTQLILPDSGEPEDMLKDVVERAEDEVNEYYEIYIHETYAYNGCIEKTTCNYCRRSEMNSSNRKFDDKILWQGAPIFKIMGTHHIVITDDLKNKMIALKASNINTTTI